MAKKIVVKNDLTKEFTWIPYDERGEDEPTTFKFKALSKKELAKINDSIYYNKNDSLYINQSSISYDLVRTKVTEISNLAVNTPDNLTKIEATETGIPTESMDLLPSDWIMDLGSYIRGISENPSLEKELKKL